MPLGKNISDNIRELYKDNKRSGKERGRNGTTRSREEIVAIAIAAAERAKNKKNKKRA